MQIKFMKYTLSIIFIFAFAPSALAQPSFTIEGTNGSKLVARQITKFKEPWALTFLPDKTPIVTIKGGKMFKVVDNKKIEITGMPPVAYGGQGGLGDVVPHPKFNENKFLYFSHALEDKGKYRAVVRRAKLTDDNKLESMEMIWQQYPTVTGRGHYSHRIAFGKIGSKHEGKIFITSGDRQKLVPAQDIEMNLGKIIRLNDDGSTPTDNPWSDGSKGDLAKTFWSIGHRNILGIAFDANEQLWATEMGPRHGDEFNLISKGENYGWPIVSEGNHYSGRKIPNHATQSQFIPPKAYWIPSIAPSSLAIYNGNKFKNWNGNALVGGLVSRALIRLEINANTAKEVERFEWGKRIREVEQGPDGDIWILEDRRGGKLLRVSPN